jgi:hypothetical protein
MRFRPVSLAALLLVAGVSVSHAQQSVKAVWGSGPTDLWAITDLPAVLHFNGRGWNQTPMSGMGVPVAVWGSGPRDVFVVGEGGLAMRWDGTQWNRLTTGVTRDLVAVGGRSASEVYVVAQAENNTDRPLLLRWDGRQFTSAPLTIPFRAQALAVTPTEIIVAGYALFDPTPSERRQFGVIARQRGAAWTLSGFDGQRATDPVLAGAAWQRVCTTATSTTVVGQRQDGARVVLVQTAGRWATMPAPALPANANATDATWVLAQDCTPLFLFQQGFARYAAGRWQVVAPGLAATTTNEGASQELAALSQQMQAQIQAGRMPTQEQIMRMQQLSQVATSQMNVQVAAANTALNFNFGDSPAGWGMTGADFWVGTEAGRVVHVTGDDARIAYDALCLNPGASSLPQCQGVVTGAATAAPRTAVPQPTRPANKPRP